MYNKMALHKLFENKYNDTATTLQNLALQLTNKTPGETVRVRAEQGECGLLRLISENLKDFVTREEMTEAMETLRTERATAISDAVTAAINAHLEAEHASTETPADNTEPTA